MKRKTLMPEVHANGCNNGVWVRTHHCPFCRERFRNGITLRDHIIHQHELDRRLHPEAAKPYFRSYPRSNVRRCKT